MRVGAIDIGSNSIRLLVADISGKGAESDLATVARAGEACRLGRGLDRTGTIEVEVADRAASISAEFARRARALGASRLIVGATAALRTASNGAEIAVRIGERIGERVRVLSGEDEARLVYRSVVLGLGSAARRSSCVVFDLGGGSTEVVSGMGGQAGRWASLPFGAVSLTERFSIAENPTAEQSQALSEHVAAELMHACALMPSETPLLAGVGGTVTVLASLDRGLTAYEPSLIEGWLIRADRLAELSTRVLEAPAEERERWTVMGKGRSDIVSAGVLVVRQLAKRFPSQGLMCSTQGLRYGLARLAAEESA